MAFRRMRSTASRVAFAALILACSSASAQGVDFRFVRPAALEAPPGSFTFGWECAPIIFDPGLTSITWYYATQPDGSDRKRMTTWFRDDFSKGLFANWQPQGPFAIDWLINSDRDRKERQFLQAPRGGGEAVSNNPVTMGDFVASTLVRPAGLRQQFGLRLRLQPNGNGYQLRVADMGVSLIGGGKTIREWRLPAVFSGQWYWCEVGLRTYKREVEARVRVYDEKREKLLLSGHHTHQPDAALLRGGFVSLLPHADYAEVYLDAWDSRWIDSGSKRVRWITTDVTPGRYYLVAELHTDRRRPSLVVSPFQVEIKAAGLEVPE